MRSVEAAINKTVLENGIRVITRQMPHTHSVSMGVWVGIGARDESPEECGISHFIEHMIFKGTQRRSAFQIAKEFDAIGGHTNAFTSMEYTCFHAKVLHHHLNIMVDILGDIFLESVFEDEEIEKERAVIFQEIGMVEDSPDEFVHLLLGNAFWGNNPLGRSILGTRETILSFKTGTIKAFFKRYYSPERIVISAAGHIDHGDFIKMVSPIFGKAAPGNAEISRSTPNGCSHVDIQQRKLEQTHICLGTRGISTTDSKRFTYALLNVILGGNMSSRLFQEIRERRSLAYSIYSFITSHIDTGMTGVYVGVDPQRSHEVIEAILTEMRALKNTPVTVSELRDAKEYMKGNLLLASESTDNQMVRLAQNDIHFHQQIALETIIDHIEAVTVDDILNLASDLFQTDKLALSMLGPLNADNHFKDILYF
jgi:predicted Zn-dependent peptidase